MPRKPVIKAYNGGTWTHARMMGFIRSGLRRMSLRWGPKNEDRMLARRPSQSSNARLKWEYQCARCNGWFAGKDVAVHHVDECGALSEWRHIEDFTRRLFCEVDGFEVVCSACHKEGHQ